MIDIRNGIDGIEVTLDDDMDWFRWSMDNRKTLIDEFGTLANARRQARDGGLRFGGGAAPIIDVHFARPINP